MKYNFMGNKADENVPDQDLSNTTGSSFDDVKTETEESDTQDNSSSVYSDDTSTDTEQNNHNGSVVNEQDGHNGPIVSDIDGLYTYGQLAKLLNKPENNLRYLINTFRDFIHPVAVTTSANAKRANFKYSESDYATLKQILAYKEKGIQNAEIIKLLENGPADDNNDNEDDQIDIIGKRILALYKNKLSERDQQIINEFNLVNARNQKAIENLLQKVSDVYLEQREFYESALSETKKQNEILKGQNDKLQKQLTDAQNIISSSKDAYELNSQVISDAQEIILKQSEYIEKLKDGLSHDDEQTSEKKGFFSRLVEGLTKTRNNIMSGFDAIFSGFSNIDEDFYEELEEILIMGDIGINATSAIIEHLKEQVAEKHIKNPMECKQLLINSIKEQMRVDSTEYEFENRKSVILVIGVNGVGKTTSVGKLAGKLKDQGKKVILAAADTFRAAAGEQLAQWANRAGVDLIGGQEGADPASIVYDAVAAAKARNADVLICDTAGRLHNKKNLMEELRKIYRILEREYPEAYLETLVVLDGTTGQNALAQAKQFAEVANVNGIILTKLDGTAKGGIAVAIQSELDIPVKYIGVGETIDDLQKFDADAFVNALFDIDEKDLHTEE